MLLTTTNFFLALIKTLRILTSTSLMLCKIVKTNKYTNKISLFLNPRINVASRERVLFSYVIIYG